MAKKKDTSADKKRQATIKQLRADLKKSEAKRATLKKRATKAEASVTDLQSRLRKAEKQAKARTKNTAAKDRARALVPVSATPDIDTPAAVAPATNDSDTSAAPDSSWTVAQLRAEARRRGITGMSNKPKAELVQALT